MTAVAVFLDFFWLYFYMSPWLNTRKNADDSGLESLAKGLSVFFSICAFVTKVGLCMTYF